MFVGVVLGVLVGSDVLVGVNVWVLVGVNVLVGVTVGVFVIVGVKVGVGVGDGVGQLKLLVQSEHPSKFAFSVNGNGSALLFQTLLGVCPGAS